MKWENLNNSTIARKVHEKQPEAWFNKKKNRTRYKKQDQNIKRYSHNHNKVIIILKDYILPLKDSD